MSISSASSSAAATVVIWTDLQSDITDVIIHLFDDIIDFINFGATCRTWRSVILAHLRLRCCRRQKSSQIPWILLIRRKTEQIALPRKNFTRIQHRLTPTVPPLHFYNFSSKKSYFISHPPYLIPHIDIGRVQFIGSNNGYLIYNNNEREDRNYYYVSFHLYDDFRKRSSQNSVLHFYNPVKGTHFSLPPAPVFLRDKVIININPHSNNIVVAVVCYDENADEQNSHKFCIAIIRTGDSEWHRFNVSKVISGDSIKDIVFHHDRLYCITRYLKTIVFDGINDPAFLSREAICMEGPAMNLLYGEKEENELGEETKDEYHDHIIERKLANSPDGKVLILYVSSVFNLPSKVIWVTTRLFKHDWDQGQWDLFNCAGDHELSFFKSYDMMSIVSKSQSHLVANHIASEDGRFTGCDVNDKCCPKRLNIPDNVGWAPYFWFIPNLSSTYLPSKEMQLVMNIDFQSFLWLDVKNLKG